MAKAGYFMGGARGKVGDFVFKKAPGKTVMQVKVTPANPKTLAQGKQRLAFAMATSACAGLSFLVNHSFQNKHGEKANKREFIRVNSKMLRAAIDAFVAGTAGFKGNAQIKGAKSLQAAEYIISRGSAYFPDFHGKEDATYGGVCEIPAQGDLAFLSAAINNQEQYETCLSVLGLKPGDQISIISMYDFPVDICQYDSETNALCKVFPSRLTFKTAPDFNGTALIVDGHINWRYVQEAVGNSINIIADTTNDKVIFAQDAGDAEGNPMQAIGIVRSTKNQNGSYEYSPCQMQFVGEGNNPEIVLQSYLPQNGSSNSDYFLDHPESEGGGGSTPSPTPQAPAGTPVKFAYTTPSASGTWNEVTGEIETTPGHRTMTCEIPSFTNMYDLAFTFEGDIATSEATFKAVNVGQEMNLFSGDPTRSYDTNTNRTTFSGRMNGQIQTVSGMYGTVLISVGSAHTENMINLVLA